MADSKYKNFFKTFGPGIMFAGTCIGGSHLVQSTKAGAFYGFGLLSIILLANIFKYPFLEFASRYTSATGDSVIEGYKRVGKWVLIVFLITTFISMFIITTAIGTVTAGLANNLTGEVIDAQYWPLIIFALVFALLAYGKFNVLDMSIKVIGVILVVTVLVAFFSVIFNLPAPQNYPTTLVIFNEVRGNGEGLLFIIALMGWMPIAIDMSAWHSLWTQERIKQTGYFPKLKETLLDFNIGYAITVVLAICFLTIGAYVLYNHPEYSMEEIKKMKGIGFSKLLVDAFSLAIGDWSRPVIAIATFATMFGTSITLVDGYCRTLERIIALLKSDTAHEQFHRKQYLMWVLILVSGSYFIYLNYVSNLGEIVNIAMTLSFVLAPVFAILNFKILYNKEVDKKFHPPVWLKILAYAGIVFLSSFTVIFLMSKF